MKKIFVLALLISSLTANSQIRVSKTGRYLEEIKTGKPFFWLGDTGWELFHRLKREDAILYLDKRKAQAFNVIQAVALAELNGLNEPNRYGDVPFINNDPTNWLVTAGTDPGDKQQYDYWDNFDFVIKEAAKRNLYIGLLPTWGDKVTENWGDGPKIFNESNASYFARKLAERCKKYWNIIWILGGDRPLVYERNGKQYDVRPIWRAMAHGIQSVYGKEVFITYHPGGSADGSARYLHNEPWLKMNANQSGHGSRTVAAWDIIRNDLLRRPLKPTMDMEPCYEDHPVNPWDGKWTRESRGYFTDYDVRARIYRGVFAGGCAATYGHHSIWQFVDTSLYKTVFVGDTVIPWRDALNAKAADHIQNLKKLMCAHSDFNRIEDTLLVASNRGSDYTDVIIATRNIAKTYALIYLPQNKPLTINTSILKKGEKSAKWFDPVTGKFFAAKEKLTGTSQTLTPPQLPQRDWVLVIDVK